MSPRHVFLSGSLPLEYTTSLDKGLSFLASLAQGIVDADFRMLFPDTFSPPLRLRNLSKNNESNYRGERRHCGPRVLVEKEV